MSIAPLDWKLVCTLGFGCFLAGAIVAASVIDLRHMILPDRLCLLLAGAGFAQSIVLGRPEFADAALGALFGFSVLGAVAVAFRQLRGIDGLGFGDQKFSAAVGLWIGWEAIAPMLLIASCSALVFVSVRSLKEGQIDRTQRIPFGPFLGLGAVACWIMTVGRGS